MLPLAAAGLAKLGAADPPDRPLLSYSGPNVIIIRFGGGARRRESIEPSTTFAPFVCHDLASRGVLFKNMEIAQLKGLNTSHGEGTLNILTGKYDQYSDVEGKFLGARFEPAAPTLFEYLRKNYQVPQHQTLIINGEDRPDEEFYTFSNHQAFGINFRAQVLSLYRYKSYLMRQKLADANLPPKELDELKKELSKWSRVDRRVPANLQIEPAVDGFWEKWRRHYGDNGLVNPRGDRLLTELALRSLKELKPRLLMVNYNDCDYVHWGYLSHYTRAISIMDEGIKQIVQAVDSDEFYRNNTVVVVVPDCGRDSNPMSNVPCQHHFNSKSSHEIFGLVLGPGIARGTVVDHKVDQAQIAATIARVMKFPAPEADSRLLEEAFS